MDRANRKLLITFSGINPDTGEHHPDGFLPPNANPPAGEGYRTFTIKPKADTASGTVIRNKAKIVFDPHLGVNPPMETDEHVLTVDKQAGSEGRFGDGAIGSPLRRGEKRQGAGYRLAA